MTGMRILALDGGGSKGAYALGVLKKLEQESGRSITDLFDAIYGTSTGAIITAFLAQGKGIDEIRGLYREGVPDIMRQRTASGRSARLESFADKYLGGITPAHFKVDVGIVASRVDHLKRPMIFKSTVEAAHGSQNSFVPFFGVSVKDAVVASCSAVPFFKPKEVQTANYERAKLIDGGFCANNPSLYAVTDAVKRLGHDAQHTVLNVGVGSYPEKPFSVSIVMRVLGLARWMVPADKREDLQGYLGAVPLMMDMTTISHQFLIQALVPECHFVRVSEASSSADHTTNFVDPCTDVMERIFLHGLDSWGKNGDRNQLEGLLSRLHQ